MHRICRDQVPLLSVHEGGRDNSRHAATGWVCQLSRVAQHVSETDLLVDECCNWQAVEAIREDLPQPDVISPFALVIEAIYAVDRRALVVPTQQKEVFWVLDLHRQRHEVGKLMQVLNAVMSDLQHNASCTHLVGKQQADGLQALLPAVDIVAQEQVVGLWRKATILKQPQQIRVLPMNVACMVNILQLTSHQ